MPADMSDEDAAAFDAHHEALEKLRATPKGAAFLAALEGIAVEAANGIYEVGKVLAPIALKGLEGYAAGLLEKELNKLTK